MLFTVIQTPTKAQAEEVLNLSFPDDQAFREEFARLAESKSYANGEYLFREGQNCDGIYLVCEGSIEMSVKRARNSNLILGTMKSGDLLGLCATIRGNSYLVNAKAIQPSRILHLDKPKFLSLMEKYPSASLTISKQLSMGLDDAYQGLMAMRGIKRRKSR